MKQFAVIGVGNFGKYLAISLYKKGHEVLVIDKTPNLVNEIKDQVSQAVVADATDRKAMESLGLRDFDTVVICIGSVLSDSVLATLNMKDIGVRNILATNYIRNYCIPGTIGNEDINTLRCYFSCYIAFGCHSSPSESRFLRRDILVEIL